MSSTFVLTGVGSEFTIRHNSIILDPNKNYEAALLSLDSYNSFPNITKDINNITQSNYKVDFTVTNSFADLLGFEKIVINAGYNESTKIVDIISTNSILVNIDIVAGSYINGTPLPVIYSFYPNVPPGYKIVERPNPQLIYHPISRNDISIMRVWLTNQDNKPVDLRGETLTVRIIVREVQDIQNILRELFNYIKK